MVTTSIRVHTIEQIHALTHWFVLMVPNPVKFMAQITVFPYLVVYNHDVIDEQKQITAMLSYNTYIWWALITNTEKRLNYRRGAGQ